MASLSGFDMCSGIVEVDIVQRDSLFANNHHDVAMLDIAITHTILQDHVYFTFTRAPSEAWQTCQMNIVTGRRNFTFREDPATIVLPGGATLICKSAMYAPSAHRSLISFRDLRGHGIHIVTAVSGSEEVLELRQGLCCLATVCTGATSLYELPISSPIAGTVGQVCPPDFRHMHVLLVYPRRNSKLLRNSWVPYLPSPS